MQKKKTCKKGSFQSRTEKSNSAIKFSTFGQFYYSIKVIFSLKKVKANITIGFYILKLF